ncbi:hypothetical protein BD410DRAFT_784042 [Rickenella mellea]|uniref:Uncharacterized protein n=1 Tax=Rickenella mellea TaxID=50990 RepID=A0A4Y7QGP9_9AGAM|nr:hypothetical protein BD410DRAFT_784042 [Rickenella mellea]
MAGAGGWPHVSARGKRLSTVTHGQFPLDPVVWVTLVSALVQMRMISASGCRLSINKSKTSSVTRSVREITRGEIDVCMKRRDVVIIAVHKLKETFEANGGR